MEPEDKKANENTGEDSDKIKDSEIQNSKVIERGNENAKTGQDNSDEKKATEADVGSETSKKIHKSDDDTKSKKNVDDSDKLKLLGDDDDDDDDIPGDFFDDFLKEDFMAGLDIVDDDEWDEEKSKKARGALLKEETKTVSTEEGSVDKKNVDGKDPQKSKNVETDTLDADKFKDRRDPLKTKRAIEMDKAKQKKDRENKIISEKLRLVETGLVPPGMEMETDITNIKKDLPVETNTQNQVNSQLDKKKSTDKSLTKRSSASKEEYSPRTISVGKKLQGNQRSRSPVKKLSPKYRGIKRRSRSPRNRTRSPRNRSRSPRNRSRSPRNRSRFGFRGRKSRSPRSRDKRNSLERRSRSHSPVFRKRRRSRSLKRRRDEKKSFLQEIAEKLNETRPVNYPPPVQTAYRLPSHMMPLENTNPLGMIAPVPAPLPTQYPTPVRYDRYDQNFFIGTPEIPQSVANSFNIPMLPNPMPGQNVQSPHLGPNLVRPNVDTTHSQNSPPQPNNESTIQEDMKKLLEDKKISLTEFLAVTAKPEVYAASPLHLKEKIKVISRCQDAIKYLEYCEKKFTGPLVIQKKPKTNSNSEKFLSPLVKSTQLKLPFTEVPAASKQKSDFTEYINKLLDQVDISEDVIVIDDAGPTDDEASPQKKSSPLPAPSVSPKKSKHLESTQQIKPLENNLQKPVETGPYKCQSCERRDKKNQKSIAIQCESDVLTFSVGTQVREEDFYAKLPKNQSLASLTPAQLLARSSRAAESNNDVFVSMKSDRSTGYPYPSDPHHLDYEAPRGGSFNAYPRNSKDSKRW